MTSTTSLPSVTTKTVSQPAADFGYDGLFATTDIEPGQDVLHIKTPFAAVLDSPRLEDHCSCCFSPEREIREGAVKRCTGCRVECQSKDWKFAHSSLRILLNVPSSGKSSQRCFPPMSDFYCYSAAH
ncbi:uncharacterized protein N7515_004671 [Penicillium bovifimosum]|uniref:Uncharacterized protein n=1 Tax=Penicillium bovifimosum TaxID=126998 RepID=A0A9W9L3J9_9EURO|nr:uncharacterized protein N7515_004671 [Penicillium bovifimosum]KAJ5135393.1 hypothetical protein N7515_004671 [Penicillium bovifimosum]